MRSSPVTSRTPISSLTPAATQRACAAIVSGFAGASSPRTNTWFSSMRLPSYGRLRRIAGPPVENSKRCPPATAAPSTSVSPAFTVKLQRTPAGRSRAKSYTQLRGSAQRPVPFSAQSIVNGSTSRGSPNGTIGFAKRAVTWRTPLTSPRGLKNSTGLRVGNARTEQERRGSCADRRCRHGHFPGSAYAAAH